MDGWIGPAIVAAIISGLVSLIVVQLNFRQSRKIEQIRRDEKVRDFQIALRAELISDLLNIQVADRAVFLREVTEAYKRDASYSPVIPRVATNVVFDAVVQDIHILPETVIAPLVHYARLRQSIEFFVEDMRADSFTKLPPDRQLLMYSDYLAMWDRLEILAVKAHDALNLSLHQ